MLCVVCHSNTGQYKCPVCHQRYCSVVCSKIHKQECKKPKEEVEQQNNQIVYSPFEKLRSCKEIMNYLGDKRLQKLIKKINDAEDREGELTLEMKKDLYFAEFINSLLDHMPEDITP